MQEKLKPCPRPNCRGEAVLDCELRLSGDRYFVWCNSCNLRTWSRNGEVDNKETAIAKWQYAEEEQAKQGMDTEVSELKPCPSVICGSDDVDLAGNLRLDNTHMYDVTCRECGAGTPFFPTRQEAVDYWHDRPGEEEWCPGCTDEYDNHSTLNATYRNHKEGCPNATRKPPKAGEWPPKEQAEQARIDAVHALKGKYPNATSTEVYLERKREDALREEGETIHITKENVGDTVVQGHGERGIIEHVADSGIWPVEVRMRTGERVGFSKKGSLYEGMECLGDIVKIIRKTKGSTTIVPGIKNPSCMSIKANPEHIDPKVTPLTPDDVGKVVLVDFYGNYELMVSFLTGINNCVKTFSGKGYAIDGTYYEGDCSIKYYYRIGN